MVIGHVMAFEYIIIDTSLSMGTLLDLSKKNKRQRAISCPTWCESSSHTHVEVLEVVQEIGGIRSNFGTGWP